MAKAIRAGYAVSIPFGPGHRYDLIFDDGNKLSRIQCKTGCLRDGCVRFEGCSVNIRGDHKGYTNEIDFFAVYCGELDTVYMIPVSRVGRRGAWLRVVEPKTRKNYSRILWAKDFKLTRLLPTESGGPVR